MMNPRVTAPIAFASTLPLPAAHDIHAPAVSSDWRQKLPVFAGKGVTIRELRQSDAQMLFTMLTAPEVARFVTPPPTTVEGFEKFIAWTARERAAGRCFTFGIVPTGFDDAVGLIQVRALAPNFSRAEWGFALGSAFWGCNLFQESARMTVDFAMDTVGVHRIEARSDAANGRGNGALRKLGAVEEAVMRGSFRRDGQHVDQILWSILDDDWRARQPRAIQTKTVWGARVH
jgi:ribosomal-protein-alanine N-acetyltransferase